MAGFFSSLFSRRQKKKQEVQPEAEQKLQENTAAAVPQEPDTAAGQSGEQAAAPAPAEVTETAAAAAAEQEQVTAAAETAPADTAVEQSEAQAAEETAAEIKEAAAEPAADQETAETAEAEPESAAPAEETAPVAAEESAAEPQNQAEPAAAEQDQDTAAAAAEEKKEVRESFFARLKKTRENLAFGLSAFFKGRKIDEDLYEELETSLLTADLGVETTDYVISKLREEAKLRELHDASLLKKRLRQILISLLAPCEQPLQITRQNPYVILMVGVNGAGKTTTIGKLARKYKDQGLKVMLAAGDTFRAAAVEQLKEWGARADVPVIAQPTGSDSASVIFDALTAAKSRGMDVLICDTAGRLQNKSQLMEELKKIVRVMRKIDAEVPHEVLLVLDAATGQNAVSQTKIFKEAVEVSGICLTKLDGTAKGGVIFALADKFKLPLRFVGLGEKAEDLRPFDAEAFVDALLRED